MSQVTRTVPYVGETLTITPGKQKDYARDFVDLDSPRGLRNICQRLTILQVINLDSVTTGTIQGEDFCQGIQQLTLRDSLGERVRCEGQKLRLLGMYTQEEAYPDDASDQAATSSAVTASTRHELMFALPFMARTKDFGLPVDHLRKADTRLRIQAAGNSSIQQPSGSYVINASTGITYTVIAWCWDEWSYERKSRWAMVIDSTKADARFPIEGITGRPLLGILLHKEGASGGASMANITDVIAPRLGLTQTVEDSYLEDGYIADTKNGTVKSKDPIEQNGGDAANASAFPLLWKRWGMKVSQAHMVGATPEVLLTESSAITNKEIVKIYVTPPSTANDVFAARARGVDLAAARPKTLDGKKLSSNDPFAVFLPEKVPGRAGAYQER